MAVGSSESHTVAATHHIISGGHIQKPHLFSSVTCWVLRQSASRKDQRSRGFGTGFQWVLREHVWHQESRNGNLSLCPLQILTSTISAPQALWLVLAWGPFMRTHGRPQRESASDRTKPSGVKRWEDGGSSCQSAQPWQCHSKWPPARRQQLKELASPSQAFSTRGTRLPQLDSERRRHLQTAPPRFFLGTCHVGSGF